MTAGNGAPTLSVVVPTYRRASVTAGLVELLLTEPGVGEVVVAVDGPDPALEQLLALVDDDRLLVVVLPENRGQAAAREAGARVASGEVLLLLDDDVRPEPGTALGHAAAHAQARGLVVVGHNPVELPAQRRPGMAATYLYATEYDRAWQALLDDHDAVLSRLWAGQVSVRRTDYLAAVGDGWPAQYHEDQDLGLRLRERGLRGAAVPALRSRHHHSRTLEQSVEEARRQGHALALLCQRWPDLVAPDYATRPGPLHVLRLISRPVLGRRVVGAALAVAKAAGRLRCWPLETAGLRLARQTSLRMALRAARPR